MMRRRGTALATLALLLLWQPPADAAFHEWDIAEVYSNADGSVQYIELVTTFNGQDVLANHTLTATWTGGNMSTFTFPTNSPMGTSNKRLLLATPGFAKLPGAIAPDFTLPCGPFFDPAATSITVNFAGVDSVTFAGSAVPVNGDDSLNRNGGSMVSGAATPVNFAGNAGALALTACQVAGTCDICDDGLFCNGTESCSGFACVATGACNQICDEDQDTCVECDDPADCNDSNGCTDDACTSGECVNTPNTAACDDGLFCTQTDVCSAGSCMGSGDPCAGQNCSEGLDACVDCTSPADCDDANPCTDDLCSGGECSYATNTAACDDGLFCTMNDQCDMGVCGGSGDACASGQICDEVGNACLDCDEDSDCDDGAECTSDTCVDGTCEHVNVTFGTPCQNDGEFCSGPEQCASGVCQSLGDPCGVGTMCNEVANTCDEPDEPGDGGAGPGSGAGAAGGGGPDDPGPSAGGSGDTGSAGQSGTPLDDDAGSEDDGGCGCRAAGSSTRHSGWLALVALSALAFRRSRRRA
jgi:MYXO-CTERM domain-containing protein